MRTLKKMILLVALCGFFNIPLIAQDWLTKIQPLNTTLAEVKELVGGKVEEKADSVLIRTKHGNLLIDFSKGSCVESAYGGWDVPEGTVTHIAYYPKKKRKLSDFEVNIKSMKRDYDSGQQVFSDLEKGISYWVQFNTVTTIRLFPSEQNAHLRCIQNQIRDGK